MTPPRTIILTPPGHQDCKVSPGPWTVGKESGTIIYGATKENLTNNRVAAALLCDEQKVNARYIAECMGEAPAWEGWARHIFADRSDLFAKKTSIRIVEGETYSRWELSADGLEWIIHATEIQQDALAWLLRAGCAKEVVS